MSSGRKRFKILTHRRSIGTWLSSLNIPRSYDCPEYVVVSWCEKRRRFRFKDVIATGIPYAWSETRIRLRDIPGAPQYGLSGYANVVDSYGQQLADQNGLPWVKTFDPQWKLHDLMLMRLKGKL